MLPGEQWDEDNGVRSSVPRRLGRAGHRSEYVGTQVFGRPEFLSRRRSLVAKINKGDEVVVSFQVNRKSTIDFMGEDLRVYATPSMVHDLEAACRDFLAERSGENEDSVGARVEISHLAPSLVGQTVTIRATVTEIELPRVTFAVHIRDDVDVIGSAVHTRFIVDKARQAERLRKKAQRWQAIKPVGADKT
jgi:fluoroacetyl-CoA thioesterase